jgi:hypothetical protein
LLIHLAEQSEVPGDGMFRDDVSAIHMLEQGTGFRAPRHAGLAPATACSSPFDFLPQLLR